MRLKWRFSLKVDSKGSSVWCRWSRGVGRVGRGMRDERLGCGGVNVGRSNLRVEARGVGLNRVREIGRACRLRVRGVGSRSVVHSYWSGVREWGGTDQEFSLDRLICLLSLWLDFPPSLSRAKIILYYSLLESNVAFLFISSISLPFTTTSLSLDSTRVLFPSTHKYYYTRTLSPSLSYLQEKGNVDSSLSLSLSVFSYKVRFKSFTKQLMTYPV